MRPPLSSRASRHAVLAVAGVTLGLALPVTVVVAASGAPAATPAAPAAGLPTLPIGGSTSSTSTATSTATSTGTTTASPTATATPTSTATSTATASPTSTSSSGGGLGLPGLSGPTATSKPVIKGTPETGMTLEVTPPTWDQSNVTTTYQWDRNGTAISKATDTTYTVQPADVGASLTVVATGQTTFASSTSTSDAVTGKLGAAPTPTKPPTISGTPAPGSTLTVAPGTWPGTPTPTFTFQWYRKTKSGGVVKIPGASGTTYQPTSADVGRSLAVLVTAARPGYATAKSVSNIVAVPKDASTLTLGVGRGVKTTATHVNATIRLQVADSPPVGKVRIYDGTRQIAQYSLASVDGGHASVPLPLLKAGRHVLRATYAGTSSIAPDTAPAVRFTVQKAAASS